MSHEMTTRTLAAAALAVSALLAHGTAAQPVLTLGSPAAAPGAAITVPVSLAGAAGVCAASYDVTFDPAALTATGVTLGPAATAAGKQLAWAETASGVVRVGVFGGGQAAIANGDLALVAFAVATTAAGVTALGGSCGAADCTGTDIAVGCAGGSVTVTAGCALACSAAVPATAVAGTPVTFPATATATGCAGAVTYDWDFGDGSAHASEPSPSHVYQAAGSFPWSLTVSADGQSCSRSGTIVVSGAACTVTCSALAPPTAVAGAAVAFTGTASASGCAGAVTYDWDFGDGSAHATQQSPSHVFQAPGTYAWRLTASAGGTSCTSPGSITVSAPPAPYLQVVPSVAHLPGKGGTQWRSDVAVVNRTGGVAALTLRYEGDGGPLERTASVGAGGTVRWQDVLVSLFSVATTAKVKGTLEVRSTVPVVVTSRTYNQTVGGTYGQYYPALEAGEAIVAGQVGVLAQLEGTTAFRTNVGIVNLGAAAVTVAVRLFEAGGAQVGSVKRITAGAGLWVQQDDIFAACAAGSRPLAYATVEVETAGGAVWAYASVIDQATGDPTTIPVLLP